MNNDISDIPISVRLLGNLSHGLGGPDVEWSQEVKNTRFNSENFHKFVNWILRNQNNLTTVSSATIEKLKSIKGSEFEKYPKISLKDTETENLRERSHLNAKSESFLNSRRHLALERKVKLIKLQTNLIRRLNELENEERLLESKNVALWDELDRKKSTLLFCKSRIMESFQKFIKTYNSNQHLIILPSHHHQNGLKFMGNLHQKCKNFHETLLKLAEKINAEVGFEDSCSGASASFSCSPKQEQIFNRIMEIKLLAMKNDIIISGKKELMKMLESWDILSTSQLFKQLSKHDGHSSFDPLRTQFEKRMIELNESSAVFLKRAINNQIYSVIINFQLHKCHEIQNCVIPFVSEKLFHYNLWCFTLEKISSIQQDVYGTLEEVVEKLDTFSIIFSRHCKLIDDSNSLKISRMDSQTSLIACSNRKLQSILFALLIYFERTPPHHQSLNEMIAAFNTITKASSSEDLQIQIDSNSLNAFNLMNREFSKLLTHLTFKTPHAEELLNTLLSILTTSTAAENYYRKYVTEWNDNKFIEKNSRFKSSEWSDTRAYLKLTLSNYFEECKK